MFFWYFNNFQSVNSTDVKINLELSDIKFPNKDNNWYSNSSQHYQLYSLKISNCTFAYFHANAFNSRPFHMLYALKFHNFRTLYTDGKMFNGLELRALEISSSNIRSIAADFLAPIRRKLTSLTVSCVSPSVGLATFFGTRKLLNLRFVTIVGCNGNASRILRPVDFLQLPRVQGISLRACNIELIEAKTFNYIGETLSVLDLSFNRLKTMHLNWYAVFLDWSTQLPKKYVLYAHNPIVCDCDFYEVQNLTLLLTNSLTAEGKLPVVPHYCKEPGPDKCENLQELSMQKLIYFGLPIGSYSFPKVNLRISNGTLMVRTQFKAKFRIWIHNWSWREVRKRSKCPSPEWLRDSVQCIAFPAGENQMLSIIEHLRRSPLISIYVILLVANKRVWPLHIQSARMADAYSRCCELHNFILVSVITCVGGFFIGLLCMISFGKQRRKTEDTFKYLEQIRFVYSSSGWQKKYFHFVLTGGRFRRITMVMASIYGKFEVAYDHWLHCRVRNRTRKLIKCIG